MSGESRRLDDLRRFYRILGRIEAKNGTRCLSACNGRMAWPRRGVYFFRIEPLFVEITRGSEVEHPIAEMMRWRAQALVVGGAPMIYDARAEITGTALKQALPTFGGSRAFVEAGAVMSYHDSVDELRRRGAAFIDKILRGANPGDLPIERPTQFELGINLNAAKALAIVVPQSLIGRADYVIQ